MTGLRLAQAGALGDWHLFVSRLRRISPDPAVRLSVHMDVLVLTGAPLYPATLGDPMPLVLAMRMLRLADPAADGLDRVVPASALADRFARAQAEGSQELAVPPVEVPVPWTARTPPRDGWGELGPVPTDVLVSTAESGIAEIATGTPEGAGSHAVNRLRQAVWSAPVPVADDDRTRTTIPAGAAFAMDRMGFLHRSVVNPDEEPVRLFAGHGWMRLTSPVGHVLFPATGPQAPRRS